jgi:hypothetical protein
MGVRGVFVCSGLKEKWYSRRQKAEGRRLQAKKIKGFNN